MAAARDSDTAPVSVAEFLPTFFGWRFGAAVAERQLAAFQAGLRAEAGSSDQLRSFCGVIGLQLDQLGARGVLADCNSSADTEDAAAENELLHHDPAPGVSTASVLVAAGARP